MMRVGILASRGAGWTAAESFSCLVFWIGVREDVFSLTFRRPSPSDSVSKDQATVKAVHRVTAPHKSLSSSTDHTLQRKWVWRAPYSHTASCLANCFYQALNPLSTVGWGWTILVFPRCESNYSIVSPTWANIIQGSRGQYSCMLFSVQPGRLLPAALFLKAGVACIKILNMCPVSDMTASVNRTPVITGAQGLPRPLESDNQWRVSSLAPSVDFVYLNLLA